MIDDIPDNYVNVKRQIAVRFVQSSLAVIRNIGYSENPKNYNEFIDKSRHYIQKYKKSAKGKLTNKENILVLVCLCCPRLLILMYSFSKN